MSDGPDPLPSPRACLCWLWLSLLALPVVALVADLQRWSMFKASWNGSCEPIGPHACTYGGYLANFDGLWDWVSQTEILVWAGLTSLTLVLLWGLAALVLLLRSGLGAHIRADAGYWLAGAVLQSALNLRALAYSAASETDFSDRTVILAFGLWEVGGGQILWLVPLLTLALLAWPRVAPGLLLSATISAVLALPMAVPFLLRFLLS